MDFEKMFKDEMEDIAMKVEAGLGNREAEDVLTKDDVESIVRSVVREELAVAIKGIKEYINTVISESQGDVKNDNRGCEQRVALSNTCKPKIEYNKKVSYDVRGELCLSMTCGGWTFGANYREGKHLWAVNDVGTEYYELYPKTISFVSKIEEGYVYFTDADYNNLRICISDGKVEKVKEY